MAQAYENCRFFCIKCGNEGIPLQRRQSSKKELFHRKKLYCLHCKTTLNHIECKTDAEVAKFKEDFLNGVFIDEAEESVSYVRNTGIW